MVIQVGDLVHRGPDSDKLVTIADTTKNWVQLFGNHEANYCGGPTFSIGGKNSSPKLLRSTIQTIKRWRAEDQAYLAAGVRTAEKEYLLTHSGVTYTLWVYLGRPDSLEELTAKLNDLSDAQAFAPGLMLGGYTTMRSGAARPVGPVWAEASMEVYPSWVGHEDPTWLNQVHGHSSVYSWTNAKWRASEAFQEHMMLLKDRRHIRTSLSGHEFWGIDPGLGFHSPHFKIKPLILEGELVLPDARQQV